MSAGRGFVKIGGLFLWSWVVFSGASRFVSGFFPLDSKSISGGVVYDETIFNYSICNKMK